jgi:hypothetical protein
VKKESQAFLICVFKIVPPQKKEEAQDLADTLLDAEIRLGEMFEGLEKKRGNQYVQSSISGTKHAVIKSLGFKDPKKTAYRFELLASRPDIVECLDDIKRQSQKRR